MRNIVYLFLITLFACNSAQTQVLEKIALPLKGGHTTSCVLVKPKTEKIKGVLVLIAGFGQTAEHVFPESKIPEIAHAHDLLTVSVGFGAKMYADSAVVNDLNEIVETVLHQYGVDKTDFIFGGFSIGGAIAVRYVEYCKEQPDKFPVVPRGVFAVDSPVDLIDLWYYFEREMARDFDPTGVAEAKYVADILKKEIGTPETNRPQYELLTPFDRNKNTPGNEQYLKTVPLRVYHDLDINWYLKNRRRSAYDCNFPNSSELINRLMGMGNKAAEFVVGKTGYRSNGTRHPHAWSIVDETAFVEWANKLFQD